MKKRIMGLSVLPGEPLDGSGKICIHLFVPDSAGPFTEPHVLRINESNGVKNMTAGPVCGRLACDSKKTRKVAPVERSGITQVTMRTDDPRAVTCFKCKTSQVFVDMSKVIADAEATR